MTFVARIIHKLNVKGNFEDINKSLSLDRGEWTTRISFRSWFIEHGEIMLDPTFPNAI